MPFLGKQPSRGLVGTADIDDNAVTLAKMAHQDDGSIITYGTDTAPVLLAPDTSGEVLTTKGAGALPAFDAVSSGDFLLYHNSTTADTAGTEYTKDAWRTVTLDTEVYDTGSNGSLSTSVITLAAGTYRVMAKNTIAAIATSSYVALRFRNTSDSSTVCNSSSFRAHQDETIWMAIYGRFTIAGSKNFELQIFPGSQNAYEAGNFPVDNTEEEIFGVVYLEKE